MNVITMRLDDDNRVSLHDTQIRQLQEQAILAARLIDDLAKRIHALEQKKEEVS